MTETRKVVLLVLCLGAMALARSAGAWDRGNLADYHDRRARLVAETGDGVVVLFGYGEQEVAASDIRFRQNEEFYYLTGWNEPDAILLLIPAPRAKGEGTSRAALAREILFIPAHDYRQEKWTGPKLGPDDADAPALTGFAEVRSTALFQAELLEALKKLPKIYTELTPQPESGEDWFQQSIVGKLRTMAPLAELADLRHALARMRAIKSPGELALMRKAADNSIEAHLAAMKAVRPGRPEYEIAALMKYEFERRGSEWPSYPPIVGSGFFSTVLHYDSNDHQMQDGDLVVLDVGGSYGGYASDITRTLPVNGHFTPRQREIYQIVLGAQEAVLRAARPGKEIGGEKNSLLMIARQYLHTHGADLHGKPLDPYFIHGIGHSVGLNVHDPMEPDLPLAPGMVITDEPGIYIPEEKIGIRIEDMMLITADGAENLTGRLPRAPEEIEKNMARQ